jgi:lipoprotein NlpI/transglutaminase-like putative cysteine protease
MQEQCREIGRMHSSQEVPPRLGWVRDAAQQPPFATARSVKAQQAWCRQIVTGLVSALLCFVAGGMAQAAVTPNSALTRKVVPSDGYRVAPVPAWVLPAKASQGSNADSFAVPTLNADEASAGLVVLRDDTQIKLSGQGKDSTQTLFRRVVRQINTSASLEEGSQWQIEFDPSYERLVIHSLVVLRGQQRLDRLRSTSFKMLHRETQLERQMIDGRMTASVVMPDIRVGDRLELAYSIEGANPVYGGRFVHSEWMSSVRGPMVWDRLRVVAPESRQLQLRADAAGRFQVHEAALSTTGALGAGSWREWTVTREHTPQFQMAPNTPPSEWLPDQVDVSEFADWADVGRWAHTLFAAQLGTVAPNVDAQAQALKRDTPEATVVAVLDFVQNQIRYFGSEDGINSHQPAAPTQVLQQRFGDCKDKVTLLVALLKQLHIGATPLMVSAAHRGDALDRLPSPLAFDHAIVRVTLGDQAYVLDATRPEQRGPLAEREVLGWGRGLLADNDHPSPIALPGAEGVLRFVGEDTLEFTQISQDPKLTSQQTYYGEQADGVRAALASGPEQRTAVARYMQSLYAAQFHGATPTGEMKVEEVEGHDAITLRQTYTISNYLRLVENRVLAADIGLVTLQDDLRLPDQAPRKQSLQLALVGVYKQRLKLLMPEAVWPATPDRSQSNDGDAYQRVHTSVERQQKTLILEGELSVQQPILPAKDWTAHRDALLKLWPHISTTQAIPTLSQARADKVKSDLMDLSKKVQKGDGPKLWPQGLNILVESMVQEAQLAEGWLPPQPSAEVRLAYAENLDNLGRPVDALPYFKQVLSARPEDVAALTALAVNAEARRADEEALGWTDKALKQQGNHAEALTVRARALYYLGRYEEARQALDQAMTSDPGEQSLYVALWQALTAQRLGLDVTATLAPYAAQWSDRWPRPVLDVLLQRITPAQARSAAAARASDALGQLCELDFYLGESALINGKTAEAERLFGQSLDTHALGYIEFMGAARRLNKETQVTFTNR